MIVFSLSSAVMVKLKFTFLIILKVILCTHSWISQLFFYIDDMVLITEKKTWEEALVFCRKNYSDLAMMTDKEQQTMVQNKVKIAETEFVWVGLLYACFFEEWIWVNGHWVSSDNENWQIRKESHGCGVSGAMQKNQMKWVKRPLGEQYNFVCSIH
uniref:C-type lectin domain-containing protein n=1 Tax=Periophthalmus magnuspinnatus TaxID=409849 RepID=A0A3B4B3N3_9GOBI